MSTCSDCRWWEPWEDQRVGFCRARPPVVVALPEPNSEDRITVTRWPETAPYDWCKEFLRRDPRAVGLPKTECGEFPG